MRRAQRFYGSPGKWTETLVMMVALLLMSSLATAQQTLFVGTSQPAGLTVSMQSELAPLALNEMHAWTIELSTREGEAVTGSSVTLDGGMPEHDHGLPTRPQVVETDQPGRYRAEGVRFHMGGDWRLNLEVMHEGRRYRFSFALTL